MRQLRESRFWMGVLGAISLTTGCTRKLADAPTPSATPSAFIFASPSISPFAAPTAIASATPAPLPTVGPASSGAPLPLKAGTRVIGTYYDYQLYRQPLAYTVNDLPLDYLTHVLYGYAKVNANGEAELGDVYGDLLRKYPGDSDADPLVTGAIHGNFGQLRRVRKERKLETLILVGGYTNSENFATATATAEARDRLASSIRYLFTERYPEVFDGVALDWEYPVAGGKTAGTRAERANYLALVRALRLELDARAKVLGRPLRLVVELPGSPSLAENFDVAGMAPLVDWFDVHAFDLHGPGWEAKTNFTAPIYAGDGGSLDGSVAAYLGAGMPAEKLVLGTSFYGHAWQHVPAANQGLYQQAAEPRVPAGTNDTTNSGPSGTYTYADLAANYLKPGQRHWSEAQQAAWWYDPARQLFITGEDARSLAAKGEYLRSRGLGGMSIWDPGADDAEATLTKAMAAAIRP